MFVIFKFFKQIFKTLLLNVYKLYKMFIFHLKLLQNIDYIPHVI